MSAVLVSAPDRYMVTEAAWDPERVRWGRRTKMPSPDGSVEHLQQSGDQLADHDHQSLHDRVQRFLQEHCVHWIEPLGLMRRMSEGVPILRTFGFILTVHR